MSRDQQILNLLVARAMFDDISDKEISKDLTAWRCGSAACFGGWVAVHPFFIAQGVEAERTWPREVGKPVFNQGGWSYEVSDLLFGKEMFHPQILKDISEREEIYGRIETQLNNLLDAS